MTTLVDVRPTVFVVDDDEAIRSSLTMMVQNMGLLVESYCSADEFLKTSDPACVGCVVLDVRMPGITGIELQEKLVASSDQRPVIFITGHGDVPMCVKAMKDGAVNFLEKPYSPRKLATSIHKAIELATLRHQIKSKQLEAKTRLAKLTFSEREVMGRIVAGKINKTIAAELDVSLRTVEYRRASLLRKLEVDNNEDLIVLAKNELNDR